MDFNEYNKVKTLDYGQYCNYLQNKYGVPKGNYFTESWVKNTKISRTKLGLYIHHIKEDSAIMLSQVDHAKNNPYEYQKAENLVYCNLLEHLFLHILICEQASVDKIFATKQAVGIGGIINFIVPECNDLYSGWKTQQPWRQNCHDVIINNKDVYLELLKRFKHSCKDYMELVCSDHEKCLCTSMNSRFQLWDESKNKPIYKLIESL